MTNEQLNTARGVLNRYPSLGVAVGESTLTPFMADNPTQAGAAVNVLPSTLADDLRKALMQSCQDLLNG